jgi:hypothetical protein
LAEFYVGLKARNQLFTLSLSASVLLVADYSILSSVPPRKEGQKMEAPKLREKK